MSLIGFIEFLKDTKSFDGKLYYNKKYPRILFRGNLQRIILKIDDNQYSSVIEYFEQDMIDHIYKNLFNEYYNLGDFDDEILEYQTYEKYLDIFALRFGMKQVRTL